MNFSDGMPVILSLSLHDPSGGSGIHADIETACSLGCHCASVITTLCAQDTHELKEAVPVSSHLLIEQTRAILEDMPVAAIKIGSPGSVENTEAIHSILRDYPNLPLVLDPCTHLFTESTTINNDLIEAMQTLLLPHCTLVVTNMREAHDLAQQADTLDACAQEILDSGCEYVLMSGTKKSPLTYDSVLYDKKGVSRRYSRERMKVISRGHGTTLTASIACYLAHGLDIHEAVEQGQNFTSKALAHHHRLGMGKHFLNRFFWANKNNREC